MRARIHYHRGADYIVWLDSKGQGFPVLDTRRAWRQTIYRQPKLRARRAA